MNAENLLVAILAYEILSILEYVFRRWLSRKAGYDCSKCKAFCSGHECSRCRAEALKEVSK